MSQFSLFKSFERINRQERGETLRGGGPLNTTLLMGCMLKILTRVRTSANYHRYFMLSKSTLCAPLRSLRLKNSRGSDSGLRKKVACLFTKYPLIKSFESKNRQGGCTWYQVLLLAEWCHKWTFGMENI